MLESPMSFISSLGEHDFTKEDGGMGLLFVLSLNTLCKMKMLWKVLSPSTTFAHWCSNKYISIWKSTPSQASALWKEMIRIDIQFKHKISLQISINSELSLSMNLV